VENVSSPLVSILTPVHNDAQYLAECIESVLAQTYKNWEYTVVDNCSSDGSADIARRYATRDARIRVHENQQFLRVVSNHNVTLRQMSPASKYCKMIFADDWMFPECLERMVAIAEEHPSVGIVGSYSLQGREVMWSGLPYPSTLVCGRELGRRILLEPLYVLGSATTMLYRAELVRSQDPFYNESNVHADTEACFALLRSCDFGFVHQVLTFTRERAGSLSTMSTDLNTHKAGMLHVLLTYGSDYLTRRECEECLGRQLSDYYRFLGKNLLLAREDSFWQYHQKKLIESGLGFNRLRLARGLLQALCSSAAHPIESAGKMIADRKARRTATHERSRVGKPIVLPTPEDDRARAPRSSNIQGG
jgi:glycosyltransferase involved in cell wall biosynthesis